MSNIDTMSVNAIRILAADAIQKANSGHPGLPLGSAAMAYELWTKHMNHNPQNANWPNRDRFVLSGGHGSALLYSLLHLFGYGELSVEDLKQFRQFNSLTPGHPEYGHTVGVEATTGPLGAGLGMAVGMAAAEAHLAAKFNTEDFPIIDHYTYVLAGDGCMMEGISSEACSMAGTLGLGKLIVLYDSNQVTIEGDTDITFTEDVAMRFRSFGFHTLTVEDGNNLEEIAKGLEAARAEKNKPSMITVKTRIGYGCPAKEGKASSHGEPLGVENVAALRETLAWPSTEEFFVPEEVYANYRTYAREGAEKEAVWNTMFAEYGKAYPEKLALWKKYHNADGVKKILDTEEFWAVPDKADATRGYSGIVLNRLKDMLPNLLGGSADLGPSNKTIMNGEGDFSAANYAGRNLHFGVREQAMAAIGNGLILHGGLRAYIATFFVFSDYVKPMARLSSLMGLPLTFVLTHDSIGVGEDGPTHEPVEQLAMFRSMPNFTVYRPADAIETIAAWYYAITSPDVPTALVLSRQNLPQIQGTGKDALRGGYIIAKAQKAEPDAILIASGSEVELALRAKEELGKDGIDVCVVSMPSIEVFEAQPEEYKETVLPKAIRRRVVIEAGIDFGWAKYVGLDGAYVTMKGFGASAPADVLFREFGFTAENVVAATKSLF